MKIFRSNYFYVTAMLVVFYGCMVTSHDDNYQQLLNSNLKDAELGKAKFLYGDMGGIYPHTLKTNTFVYKIAIIAFNAYDTVHNTDANSIFSKYGFVFPKKIWNWQNAPAINSNVPMGLIFGKISGTHPLKGKYLIETADLGCGSCHGGPLYGKDGNPTSEFVLGMPNTSLNLKAFAGDLFEGYKIITGWNNEKFEQKIREKFPDVSGKELTGLKIIFSGLKKEVKKIMTTRVQVSPYKIGGPGTMNGIGAIKRGLGLIDNYVYHKDEIAIVSIPGYADRSFRSSFLVCGNYAPKNQAFFYEISKDKISEKHDQEMACIISLFTIGTMGYDDDMAAKAIPDVKDVMKFISAFEPPPFPADIDLAKADEGKILFKNNCSSCHGKYEGTSSHNKLVSYPNRFIPLDIIQTDSVRAVAITERNFDLIDKIKIGKYFSAQVNKGYVAPILSGVWATAPYLHNGSVPTIYDIMHPETRPAQFYVGGHQLDYKKMGIKGEMHNGVYMYPKGYQAWSEFEIYDTSQPGMSNSGHTEQFRNLGEKEKDCILEFLKTL
ncbi:MAG: hypothetical protein ABI723_00035 [Bacteroidia bacterium]